MISTSEAKSIIKENVKAMPAVKKGLEEATGLTLAGDVVAITDIPAFPQSSMDGYAFSYTEWDQQKELAIEGEMAAGSPLDTKIKPGQAVRIFTGAPVPPGADTVVMQEKVAADKGRLIVTDEKLQPGSNVRPRGSEIKAGALALPKGSRLHPAAIGFLAGIGITEVLVHPPPRITIIVTGNELQSPGQPLRHGQVYESNSFALSSALQGIHLDHLRVHRVMDDLDTLSKLVAQALESSDVVLLTGGVSVGDYDFVLPAVARCGVTTLFHKVRQRPGKPLYFGMKEEKVVFGLPGNPSSVLTCFYLYVVPALEQIAQHRLGVTTIQAPLKGSYQKASGLTHYLKGLYDGQTAALLDAQESYRMRSFAQANCLIQTEEEETHIREGSLVTIHLLPF